MHIGRGGGLAPTHVTLSSRMTEKQKETLE